MDQGFAGRIAIFQKSMAAPLSERSPAIWSCVPTEAPPVVGNQLQRLAGGAHMCQHGARLVGSGAKINSYAPALRNETGKIDGIRGINLPGFQRRAGTGQFVTC